MKKSSFLIAFYLCLLPFFLHAEQLVYIEVQENTNAEDQLKDYKKPIFYEDRFLLVHGSDSWTTLSQNHEVLGSWDESKYYFVLYPVKEYQMNDIKKYATVLKSTEQFLVIQTEHEILNDFDVFHAFKLVRVFNKKIAPVKTLPLPISSESLLFNPVIQDMVDTVSVDSVWHYIATLQSMERYTTNASAINSSNYLRDFFQSLGFDTVYFHNWQSGYIPNVVAVKYGVLYPNQIYLVGGHYDTYTSGAPGADDNGSGSASIMEMARVMSQMQYKRTLKYVLFSGEELGLLGSAAYASQAASAGDSILGMINMDMIAYVQPGDIIDVDVVKNTASQDLYNFYVQTTQLYVPTLPVVVGSLPFGASSDHASFWSNGFKAIFPFEDTDDYSPYIHSSQDVLGTSANNQTLAELGTKAGVAALAELAEIADARIMGQVRSAETLAPIENARIMFNSDSVFSGVNGSFMTPALSPDIYDIIISASGFESDTSQYSLSQYEIYTMNINLIPTGMNRPYVHVADFIIDDDSSGNSLGNNNGIVDAGETVEITLQLSNTGNQTALNITGGISTASLWANILQDSISTDTIWVDSSSASSQAVVFEIDAATPANTEIQFNLNLDYMGYTQVTSFEVTVHNRGQFLIIEDDDFEGGLAAYTTALDCLDITYDVANSTILQEEMIEYDYMIWFCGDDYSQTLTSDDQLKLSYYLDHGGKLFISGVDIGYDIHNDPFYSNYLKATYLADGPYSTTTMVYGVVSDTISGNFNTGLSINDNYLDQINPVGGSSAIFNYNDNGSYYNCGVKYNGTYQLVYLTFTFENIQNASDRQMLMNNIWNWFGGGVTNIVEQEESPLNFYLSQNYPNPFNPVTTITYAIPKADHVKLEIYNVLGQKVETLLSQKMPAGKYRIQWNASSYASGVYFYKIKSGSFEKTKKLILLR